MNRSPLDAGNSKLWKSLLTGREDLSWAGASEGDRGFCFGTEDGTVFWTNFDGMQYGDPLPNATLDDYDEAINGIAFNAGRMAVTTRSGSAIWRNVGTKMSKRKGGRVGVGSHGVVPAQNGAFLMPLNIDGLMSLHESEPLHFTSFVSDSEAMDLNVYRATSLVDVSGRQVVVLAARCGGLAMGYYEPGDTLDLTTMEIPGADFVDTCRNGNANSLSAIHALTRDSHIVTFRDVMTDEVPVTVRYEGIAGVAYRILSAGDFVFVLTSEALHVIHKLVDYSSGAYRVNRRTSNTSFCVEAVDMNLVGKRWLMILLADRVLRLDLLALAGDLASDFKEKIAVPEQDDIWLNAIRTGRKLDSHKTDLAIAK